MLPDRTEHECHVTQMSPGTAKLRTSGEGSVGERVIAYIDHIGRIVGTITKTNPSGFSIEFDLSAKKRERVSARLTWLTNKHELNLPEDRRHERLVPKRQINTLSLGDGREYSCQILDLSLSGAALEIAVRPAIGTPVTLGNLRGRIVRHFDDGVAIEFAHVQQRGTFDTFFS
ncbi:MAG: PilZ domain-containing protein [Pseudomonadota bacterium]